MIRSGDNVQIDVDETERDVVGFELPRIDARQLVGGNAEAPPESLARREPFEAVAVVRAATRERITVAIVRDAHVSELGMQ